MLSNNWDLYRAFYRVAESGSFTAAANELFLVQSTVSRMIRNLEYSLGRNLFIRTTKRLTLTPEGMFLYERLKDVFEEISRTESDFEMKFFKNKNLLKIGASELTMQHFIAPYIEKFKKKYPEITVNMDFAYSSTIAENLRAGVFDVAVLGTPIKQSDEICLRPLADLEYTLAGGTEYFKFARKQNKLKDFLKLPFIGMMETTGICAYTNSIFAAIGSKFVPECVVGSMPFFISLLKSNMGMGILPKLHIQDELNKKTLVEIPIAEILPTEQIVLLTNKLIPQNSPEKLFADLLVK
jgi:DNA-binding transcriptional LysR family regulator